MIPPPPASTVPSQLRNLLSAEFLLYAATRDARTGETGRLRQVLENQALALGAMLERVAWRLGCGGGLALVGRDAVPPATPATPASPTGATGFLAEWHDRLIKRIRRLAVRTARSGDEDLGQMLIDLLAAHTRFASTLRMPGLAA